MRLHVRHLFYWLTHTRPADFCLAIIIAIIAVASLGQKSHADTFQGMAVEVRGTGEAMIFIPGLNSGSATFTETCDAFAETHSCHLLHLPGFAGLPPTKAAQEQFLVTMRDAIKAYIKSANLEQPILVGHSLGGLAGC